MKQWKNHSAFGKVKTGLELLATDTTQILDDILGEDSDPTLAAGKVSIGVEKMAQVTGVLQTLDYSEFSLLSHEISTYLADSINAKKAWSASERAEAWKLAYLTLVDFPATLEGVLSGQVNEWHEYCLLINKLRKARNLSVVFGSKALTTNATLQFGSLFATMAANMADLAAKQLDKYKEALEQHQANGNVPQLSANLRAVFGNLEVMHRDFRMGTLWGLCQGLLDTLPEQPGDYVSAATLELLSSFSPVMEKLKEQGVAALSQNIPEDVLAKILDVIAVAPVRTSRLKSICLWYNLKLGYTRDFRKANTGLLVNYSRKGASIKAAKYLNDEINVLYDAINHENPDERLDAERLQHYMASLSRISSTFQAMTMVQQADDINVCLSLFKQYQHNIAMVGTDDTGKVLTRTAQNLYLAELALLSRSQQFGRAIAHPATGSGDILAGPKLSLVVAALKTFDSALLVVDAYVESRCDSNVLRGIVTPLAEIHIALSSIPLRRAVASIDGAIQYVHKLLDFGTCRVLTVESTLKDFAHLLLNTRSYLEQLSNDRSTNFQWALDPNERFLQNMERLSAESFARIAVELPQIAVQQPEHVESADEMPADAAVVDNEVDLQFAAELVAGTTAAEMATSDAMTSDPIVEEPAITIDEVASVAPAVAVAEEEDSEEQELRGIFIEEAEELLQNQLGYFHALRDNLDDKQVQVDLRRSFHTLKGSGRMVGATAIGELAWSAESLLNGVNAGRVTLNAPMLAALRKVHDAVPGMIIEFREKHARSIDADSVAGLVAELNQFLQPQAEPVAVARAEFAPLSEAPVAEAPAVEAVVEIAAVETSFIDETPANLEVMEEATSVDVAPLVNGSVMETAVVEEAPAAIEGSAEMVSSGDVNLIAEAVVETIPVEETAVVDTAVAETIAALETAVAVESVIETAEIDYVAEVIEATVETASPAETLVAVEAVEAVESVEAVVASFEEPAVVETDIVETAAVENAAVVAESVVETVAEEEAAGTGITTHQTESLEAAPVTVEAIVETSSLEEVSVVVEAAVETSSLEDSAVVDADAPTIQTFIETAAASEMPPFIEEALVETSAIEGSAIADAAVINTAASEEAEVAVETVVETPPAEQVAFAVEVGIGSESVDEPEAIDAADVETGTLVQDAVAVEYLIETAAVENAVPTIETATAEEPPVAAATVVDVASAEAAPFTVEAVVETVVVEEAAVAVEAVIETAFVVETTIADEAIAETASTEPTPIDVEAAFETPIVQETSTFVPEAPVATESVLEPRISDEAPVADEPAVELASVAETAIAVEAAVEAASADETLFAAEDIVGPAPVEETAVAVETIVQAAYLEETPAIDAATMEAAVVEIAPIAIDPVIESAVVDEATVAVEVVVETPALDETPVAVEALVETASPDQAPIPAESAFDNASEASDVTPAPFVETALHEEVQVTNNETSFFAQPANVTDSIEPAVATIEAFVESEPSAEHVAEAASANADAEIIHEVVPEPVAVAVVDSVSAEDKQTESELFDVFVAEVARQIGIIREYLNNPHMLDGNGFGITTTSFLIPVHTLYGSSRMAHFDEFGRMVSPLERLLQSHPYRTVTTSLRLLLIQFCQLAEQVSEHVGVHRNLSLQGALGAELTNLRSMIEDAENSLALPRRIDTVDADEALDLPAPPIDVEAGAEISSQQENRDSDEQVDEEALVLRGFLQEARTTGALLQQLFASFRASPGSNHLVTQLHDQLGNLEGAANLVNATSIGDMSRAMALAYQRYSRRLFHMSPAIVDVLAQGHDYLHQALLALSEGLVIDEGAAIIESLQNLIDTHIADKSKDEQSESDQEVEQALLGVFLEEADEILREIDKRLADWEQVPDDQSVANDLLRLLHTLKGSAALVGETEISEHAHAFESVIIASTRNATACDAAFFANLHVQLDTLQTLYAQHGNADAAADNLMPIAAETATAAAPVENIAPADASPEAPAGNNVDSNATRNGQVFYIRPDVAAEAKAPAPEAAADQSAVVDDTIRVSGSLLRSLLNDADEINIARNRVEQNLSELRFMLKDMDETLGHLKGYIEKFEAQTIQSKAAPLAGLAPYAGARDGQSDFDAIEMDRYSEFQQMALSLLEDYEDLGEIRKNLSSKLKAVDGILGQQQRFTNRLQDGLISSQMVPFAGMMPRLRRLTRQVSAELGKQVAIKFSNPEGRMDRSILQSLYGPLEHLIRNAIDHGIETPAERLQNGKPEQGTILIKLYRQGASVNLDVSDDGRGINPDAVRRKAIALGLVEEGAPLSEQAAHQLIFAPGFSTASGLSKISGRGVGLDVVHNEISQIGGDIDVHSRVSEGTTFKFRLPLTASLNRALLFTMKGSQYVMLLNTIDGIMLETVQNLRHYATLEETTKLHYSKRSYDLAYLGQVLDGNDKPAYAKGAHSVPVLLVAGTERRMALQVDSIIGSRELVVKPLPTQFAHISGVAGVVILGDGTVVPVLDPVALVDEFAPQRMPMIEDLAPALPVSSPEHDDQCTTVLVVDDSITVRKVTSAMLKRNGMKVLVAKNGTEALEVLQHALPDIMLLDIEMPKMDGFEVASWVRRQQGALQQLPIVMITSRVGDKHRQRAAEIGVNEYMCKPFQEENLLQTIARFGAASAVSQVTG